MTLKKQLRQKILEKRLNLSAEKVVDLSQQIQSNLLKSKVWPRSGKIGLYSSVKNEVQTYFLFRKALEQGLHVYFPRVEQGIRFYEVNGPENLKKGSWGIPEPDSSCESLEEEEFLDLLVVPGIAFSKAGYRIGYGSGFYDRFLETRECRTVGLAYDFQIIDDFPVDPWDKKLSVIQSQQHIYECEKKL